MEIGCDLFDGEHANARRQCVVEGDDEVACWNRGRCRPGGDLAKRVNPRIGAPGTLRDSAGPRDSLERLPKRALDRRAFGLDLPSVKVGAVVGELELEIAHVQKQTTKGTRGTKASATKPG